MKRVNNKRLIIISRLLFVVYVMSMLYFLLFAEGFGRMEARTTYTYNLEFFKEIKRYIKWAAVSENGRHHMMLNVWGNIICFVPFGFLIPIILKKARSGVKIFIMTFLFSFTVEIIQLLLRVGSFDVDDLVLNTLGGVIGYIMFFIMACIVKKREKE